MRFLKTKIAKARAFQLQNNKKPVVINLIANQEQQKDQDILITQTAVTKTPQTKTTSKKARSLSGSCYIPETSRETKNLVKNYGKAICNFSTSSLAVPYLINIVQKEGVALEKFLEFAEKSKTKIDGLQHFREVLLSQENDDEQTAAFRRIYKQIAEVFIKYFSVNWIYDSKVKYKKAHLSFRFKMLRRIQSPELFTYLKGPKRAAAKNAEKLS